MRTLLAAFLIVLCSPVLCIGQDSERYGYDAPREWITRLGLHGSAEIDVKQGDIVKVDLIGSAEKSEFYYSIVETTGKAEILSVPTQVIMNPERWRSITTTGVFRAKEATTLKFSANFIKGDVSGTVKVAGLTLIANVVHSISSSEVRLLNQNSSKYLAVAGAGTGDGANVVIYDDIGQRDIWWFLEPQGKDRYKIRNRNSAKYLAVAGAAVKNGANVIQWHDTGLQDILWELQRVGSSCYKIRNVNSGKYLAVSGGSKKSGANVIQWQDQNQADIVWCLK